MDLTQIPKNKTPNYGLRHSAKITHIVIHAMSGLMSGTIARFQNPASQVSSHYAVGRDGKVVEFVSPEMSAWHVLRANPFCLGVEHEDMWLVAYNSATGGCMSGKQWLTVPEYMVSVDLVATLMLKYNIPVNNVIGHNDPYLRSFGNNHQDPGPNFPWMQYRQALTQKVLELKAAIAVPKDVIVEAVVPEDTIVVPNDTISEPEVPKRKAGRPRKVARTY